MPQTGPGNRLHPQGLRIVILALSAVGLIASFAALQTLRHGSIAEDLHQRTLAHLTRAEQAESCQGALG